MEESLIKCLEYTKLPELPPVWNGKDPWTAAIAVVTKYDGSSNYAIVKMREFGLINIKKDFGSAAIVSNFASIHPYEYRTEEKTKQNEGTRKATKSKRKS